MAAIRHQKPIKALVQKSGCLTFCLTEKILEAVHGQSASRIQLRQPVIVIGPERSGTTLVYALLAIHPRLYALSQMANWFPDFPFSATLLRRFLDTRNPLYASVPDATGVVHGARFNPVEGNDYWRRHLRSKKGSWEEAEDDNFSEDDLDEETRLRLPLDLKKRIYTMRKERLLLKQPGFSLKIRYLDALFPDAIFVHCIRNPFDNFASLMNRKKLYNNPDWGIRVPKWFEWGNLPAEVRAARQLSITDEIIQEGIGKIENGAHRYVAVRYEDLQDSFAATVKTLFENCGLDLPPAIENNAQSLVRKKKHNEKISVNDSQARKILQELCDKLGYAPN